MAQVEKFDMAAFRGNVAEAALSEAVRNAIYDLLRFSEENAYRVQGGSSEFGSFHHQINVRNQTTTLFTCNASGRCSVSLGNFTPGRTLVPGKLVVRLRTGLGKIPGFGSFSKGYPDRPGFSIGQTVTDSYVMSAFQKAILGFQKAVQES